MKPMPLFCRMLLLAAAGLFSTKAAMAFQTDTVETYSAANRKKTYKAVVIKPDGYTTAKAYPVVYLLHGYSDNYAGWVKKATGVQEAADRYNMLIVCPDGGFSSWYWNSPVDPAFQYETYISKELVAWVDGHYKTIANRKGRAITGLSMGGYGTWNLATSSPQLFAAIAPICGGGDPSKAWRLQHVPVWCFHGAKDYVVPLSQSQAMIDAAKPYNKEVKFTVYPETGHDSWVEAYNNDSLYTWLLAHKRYRHPLVSVSADILKSYEGSYAGQDKDTVTIALVDGKLIANPPKGRIELKPSSANTFFFDEKGFDYVEFTRQPDGKVTEFVVAGERRKPYKKIK